jgi:hypothetical protein
MNSVNPKVSFHDFQPELESFREAVFEGLSHEQKKFRPSFFIMKPVRHFLKAYSNNRNITFLTKKGSYCGNLPMSLPS